MNEEDLGLEPEVRTLTATIIDDLNLVLRKRR